MSGRKKQKRISYNPADQYSRENWAAWSNVKRLKWMHNFRDRLRENNDEQARSLGITTTELDQLDKDVAAMEATVISEQIAHKMTEAALAREMNTHADDILKALDTTGRKSLFVPPKDILGKKDN